MREAVFTVSPKRQYRGIACPTTPVLVQSQLFACNYAEDSMFYILDMVINRIHIMKVPILTACLSDRRVIGWAWRNAINTACRAVGTLCKSPRILYKYLRRNVQCVFQCVVSQSRQDDDEFWSVTRGPVDREPYCRSQQCVFQRLVSAIHSQPCMRLQLSPPDSIGHLTILLLLYWQQELGVVRIALHRLIARVRPEPSRINASTYRSQVCSVRYRSFDPLRTTANASQFRTAAAATTTSA